jgi:hypothetical protein
MAMTEKRIGAPDTRPCGHIWRNNDFDCLDCIDKRTRRLEDALEQIRDGLFRYNMGDFEICAKNAARLALQHDDNADLLQPRDDARVAEIREQQEWRRGHADRFTIGALHAACADIDYLLSLLQQPASERCTCGHRCPSRYEVEVEEAQCVHAPDCELMRGAATTTGTGDYRERNQEALRRFRTFERNWDSYNGLPIDVRAIEIAERLVAVLPEWQVVPRSDGGIQFDGPNEAEICIDVATTGAGEKADAETRYQVDRIRARRMNNFRGTPEEWVAFEYGRAAGTGEGMERPDRAVYQQEYERLFNWRDLWNRLLNSKRFQLASQNERIEAKAARANNLIAKLIADYDAATTTKTEGEDGPTNATKY